ncbi:hypothetical protein [Jannaschia rubra]|uniref:hypothetical protein n=1 Tax=Jannaschia rubra TaxID=282197 RepID=UPI00248FA956|nr:hypothetical protein [Jannaschia rubra]
MPGKATPTREDRLKAALKANMARRKAQKRERAEEEDAPAEGQSDRQDQTENG